MLIYDPLERSAATNLLSHPYILSVPESAPTGGALAGSGGSATLGANANLVNAAAKAVFPSTSSGAAAVTSAAAPSSEEAPQVSDGDAGEGNINSKDVFKGRRNDIPTTTKVR